MKPWIRLVVVALVAGLAHAQEAGQWEEAIKAFEEQDKQSPPETGGVLFAGSSTIRFWDLEKLFPELKALNRGFGGSTVADVNHYFDRIVLPHEPSTIVFYSGDNDIKSNPDPVATFAEFEKLFARVKKEWPETRLVVLGIKASKSRRELYPQMKAVNEKIAAYAKEHPQVVFVPTDNVMLDDKGQVREELLREDGLHLNDRGYEEWTALLRPVLAQAAPEPSTTTKTAS